MLHNSLAQREMLLRMNRHPQVLRRRELHRNVTARGPAKAAEGQIGLDGEWAIVTARDLPAERAVAKDAADFLQRLGVKISPAAAKQVLLEIGSCDVGFRCVATKDRVEVHAVDASALWAGWVHLENQMRTAGAALLAAGEVEVQPAWEVQIAPPTWGANYAVPDLSAEFVGEDTFASLAHSGANGMFIYGDFLLYAKDTRLAELNHADAAKHLKTLREASERAAPFGVKIYFVLVGPKLPADHAVFKAHPEARGARLAGGALHCLCSSSEIALGFHADVMKALFTKVPQLGGVICIVGGESYYHCFMRPAESKLGETNCANCRGKVAEDVIAKFMKITADAACAAKAQAAIYAWPYSAWAYWSKEPNQFALIDRLPANVALLSEIDKDQVVTRRGYSKHMWDYSVDYDGHSDRIVAQAMRCAERGRKLAIKTETSHGIELLHMPYVPAIGRSAMQWQSVRAIRPSAVLQRWGFIGMFDSVAERVAFLARWDPSFTPETATRAVAQQLFADAAPQIVQAWSHFDESVHHIPILTTGGYYMGPLFLGPAHPLPTWDGAGPERFRGNLFYLEEAEATFATSRIAMKDDLTLHSSAQLGTDPPIDVTEAEFAAACETASRGHAILQSIARGNHAPTVWDEIVEQQAIGECLYRTFRAAANTIKFIRICEKSPKDATLKEIARDELENAKAAQKLYTSAPWLNHNLRLDIGMPDTRDMLAAKVKLLETFLAG